jgi:hypothetical protein
MFGFRLLQRFNFMLMCSHLLLSLQKSFAESPDFSGKIGVVLRRGGLRHTTLRQNHAG